MITAIEIENFKAIGERVRVELKPLTLLFGPNSAGKSTIIQALHYAHGIFERHYLDPHRTGLGDDAIDLGGFENFVHNQDKRLPIRLRFDIDVTGTGLPVYRDEYIDDLLIDDTDVSKRFDELFGRMSSAWVEIEVRWVEGLGIVVTKYTVGLNGGVVATTKLDDFWMRLVFGSRVPGASAEGEDDEIQRVLLEASAKIPPGRKNQMRSRSPLCVLDIDWSHPLLVGDTGLLQTLTELVRDFAAGEELSLKGRLERQIPSALPQWERVMSIEGYRAEAGRDTDYVYRWTALCCGLTRMIVGPGGLVRAELREFRYLGPLREVPPRDYKPPRFPDKSSWARGLAAWDALYGADDSTTGLTGHAHTSEPIVAETARKEWETGGEGSAEDGTDHRLSIQEVNDWLAEHLKAGYKVRVKSRVEVDTRGIPGPDADLKEAGKFVESLRTRAAEKQLVLVPAEPSREMRPIEAPPHDIEVQPHDVGTGVSQLVPVVVLALSAKGSLVAIEEPGPHVHPALQAELGDLFIESALGERKNTMVLETHSEHLILRIMRRMRDTVRVKRGQAPAVRPEDVAVLFVEPTPNGSAVHQLRLAPDGSLLDPWPGGFFEESFGELFS